MFVSSVKFYFRVKPVKNHLSVELKPVSTSKLF